MGTKNYYTLISSLPKLVHFDQAELLPINEIQLDKRLNMLDQHHLIQLSHAKSLGFWAPTSATIKEEDILYQYRSLLALTVDSTLKEYIDFSLDLRTIMNALRLKQNGLKLSENTSSWGIGRRVRWIQDHWDDQYFGLSSFYPWLKDAKTALENGHAFQLERIRLNAHWEKLDRIEGISTFGFEAVISFYFKWQILNVWHTHHAEKSKEIFLQLVTDVIHEKFGINES